MGLFKRLRDITMASINDLLDKAEDPVKMLEQYLRDMGDDITDAEAAVAKQIAVEKRFKQQMEDAAELVEKRQQQAEKAVLSGNDELAKKALVDKKEQQEKLDGYTQQYNIAKQQADQLRDQLSEMKDEYNKLKNKKDLLIARADAAKAQKSINQAMSGFGTDNAAKGFERMESKVLQMEAEAQASNELLSRSRSLDDEFKALEGNDVDDELAALKEKLNK